MRNIIVREYLESLTERKELDYIFPILLETMGFTIISTPALTQGLAQYGKDVVALKTDKDGIKKRFYFELKGGNDKNITSDTYSKGDGVRESIHEAKDRAYKDSSIPGFNDLPVKIVLVHNGIIHPSVKETFDGMIEREFPAAKPGEVASFAFERWDIYALTDLFAEWLFNEYLLVDQTATILFKRVLVLINAPGNDYTDFCRLIDFIVGKAGNQTDMGARKTLLLFETIRMVSFIVYHYSLENANLEVARKALPYAMLRLWLWVLENKLENDAKIIDRFRRTFQVFFQVLQDYFSKTLPVARLKDGLMSEKGGRYEQVGYPIRSMEYLSYLLLYFHCQQSITPDAQDFLNDQLTILADLLNNNDGTNRPFFDNHSIPILLTLNFLIAHNKRGDAVIYLRNVLNSVILAYRTQGRLPDGRNSMETVIRFAISKTKSVYYEDKTSHLFGVMLEYMAVLDMKAEYELFKKFIGEAKVDPAIFLPFDDNQLVKYLPEAILNHELSLFDHQLFKEGYQADVKLPYTFEQFQQMIFEKPINSYDYVTNTAGFPYMLILAHVYFKTPLFPDQWRKMRSMDEKAK